MMMMEERDSVHVGNLGPIPMFLHWSFLIFLYLVVTNYGDLKHPEILLIVLTVLLMSIILHELGHGLTAMAFGARGLSITLGAFGGVCKSTRDTLPRRELLIVAAGPAVSFALYGISYGLIWWFAQEHGSLLRDPFSGHVTLLGQFLGYTASLNLMLGIFNCLPIYPLDGGQLVYNGLTMMTRNHAVVRAVCLTLAFVGAAVVLSWFTMNTHQFPVYLGVMFCFLLYNAYLYLH